MNWICNPSCNDGKQATQFDPALVMVEDATKLEPGNATTNAACLICDCSTRVCGQITTHGPLAVQFQTENQRCYASVGVNAKPIPATLGYHCPGNVLAKAAVTHQRRCSPKAPAETKGKTSYRSSKYFDFLTS